MPGAPTPPILLEPIASQAGGSYITNPMPNAPTGSNAACVEQGFPPETMQSELAGGLPPNGQDMNGFLFLVSSHTMYVQCGQTYQFNATLAAEIGGYLAGTILGMADGTGLWLCTTNGNSANPDTGGAGWIPLAAYGVTTVTGLTGGTLTLTPEQSKYPIIVLQGTLIGNLTAIFPENIQEWLVINSTTGAFVTTAKTAASGSAGTVLGQAGPTGPTGIYSIGDGNIYPSVAPLSVAISQNPTPNTLAERNNVGQLFATYFNQSAIIDSPVPEVGAVFVQNVAQDGYLRKITLANFADQMLALTTNGNGVAIEIGNGYLLQFGTFSRGGGSGTVAVTFPVEFPTGAQFAPFITPNSFPVSVTVDSYTQTGMVVGTSGGGGWWLAIGN